MPCPVAGGRAFLPGLGLRGLHHFVDVGTGREGAFPGAGNDNGFDILIIFELGQCLVKFPEQGAAEGIELIGTVQSNYTDSFLFFEEKCFVCQFDSPLLPYGVIISK